MFLIVTCQHVSGACQSHSHPVLSLCEALQKYVELSPSTPPFLTLRFHEKDLTPTPNLLQIQLILPQLRHFLSAPPWTHPSPPPCCCCCCCLIPPPQTMTILPPPIVVVVIVVVPIARSPATPKGTWQQPPRLLSDGLAIACFIPPASIMTMDDPNRPYRSLFLPSHLHIRRQRSQAVAVLAQVAIVNANAR
jgi:hypothetical protein